MSTFISLHAAAREAAERGSAVAEALRAPRVHTRASVADELAQPAAGLPPIYRSVQAERDGEGGLVKPLLLDLFCKAGGAGRGYADAGFEVVGVDIEPQPRYPYRFIQRSAFEALADEAFMAQFVAVHASPVCKVHTDLKWFSAEHHTDQIPQTREMLDATGLPYVIENVEGAPLTDPVVLCGSMFGLGVLRHRLFELGRWKAEQPACRHAEQAATSPMYPVKRYHSGKPVITMSPVIGVYGRGQGLGPGEVELWKKAMGIDWMIRDELSQAIPPAYTRHLGQQLFNHLGARREQVPS